MFQGSHLGYAAVSGMDLEVVEELVRRLGSQFRIDAVSNNLPCGPAELVAESSNQTVALPFDRREAMIGDDFRSGFGERAKIDGVTRTSQAVAQDAVLGGDAHLPALRSQMLGQRHGGMPALFVIDEGRSELSRLDRGIPA